MSLLEKGFDIDIDIENVDGVKFGDVFYLNYYNINVFFYVCRTGVDQVAIFELAKKKVLYNNEKVEVLAPGLKPARNPLVVIKNNCWTKSEFYVRTTKDKELIIPVAFRSPLYLAAIELGNEFPTTGNFRAFLVKDCYAYFGKIPEKIKKIKKINKINKNA